MEAQERLHADDEVRRTRTKEAKVRARDYAFEALAEVTASDPAVARGALNAALRDIRRQTPELEDSYLLSAEIHERAKLYAQVWPTAALTPTALSKHWLRLPEEAKKLKRGGTNLSVGGPQPLPPRSSQNLAEARKLMETLWPSATKPDPSS